MPTGGARTRSGPSPDPSSLRQKAEWTTIAASRDGAIPAWPLTGATARELEVWSLYWRKPQAVLWERGSAEFEVAIHVRQLVAAEAHDAPVAARTLLRQQMDSLLLTLPAMRAARVMIAGDASVAVSPQPKARAGAGSRSRLRAVPDG